MYCPSWTSSNSILAKPFLFNHIGGIVTIFFFGSRGKLIKFDSIEVHCVIRHRNGLKVVFCCYFALLEKSHTFCTPWPTVRGCRCHLSTGTTAVPIYTHTQPPFSSWPWRQRGRLSANPARDQVPIQRSHTLCTNRNIFPCFCFRVDFAPSWHVHTDTWSFLFIYLVTTQLCYLA